MTLEIHPIRNDDDHARALREIERLWNSVPGTPEGDALDVLGTLVDAYERQHHRIGPPDPVEAIKFRMEQEGLPRTALAEIVGSKARASEILSRKRHLTLRMIRSLTAKLDIPAEVLIREPTPNATKRARPRKRTAGAKQAG